MARFTPRWQRFVDMWALPGIHPTNLELLQQLKTADTHHFTKNMEVVGTVSELNSDSGQWAQSHLIGVRSDVWQPGKDELAGSLKVLKKKRKAQLKRQIKRAGRLNEKQSLALQEDLEQDLIMQLEPGEIEKRRLVLKLFKNTGQRVRWCGTIEQVTTTEIHNSLGSQRCLLTLAVMLPRTNCVTYVQQNHRTLRIPSIFTFCFYDEQRMWHLTLKRRWLAISADFDVEVGTESIGMLDGKLISLGADSTIKLADHPLAANTQFVDLLTLFTASVGFHRAMRRSLRRRIAAVKAGEDHCHLIEDEEIRLRHNGRAAA